MHPLWAVAEYPVVFFYQLTPAHEAAEREIEQDTPSPVPIPAAAQERKSFIVQSANPFSE